MEHIARIYQNRQGERKMSIEQKLGHDWYIHASDKEKTYMFQEKNESKNARTRSTPKGLTHYETKKRFRDC